MFICKIYLFVLFSFFLFYSLLCLIHILKPYITRIKPSVSASKRLIYWWVSSVSVSFMIGVKGQGHRDTFLTRSLCDYWCFWHFPWLFCTGWPMWIERPHVNATFDLNSEFQGVFTASTAAIQWGATVVLLTHQDCFGGLLNFWDIGCRGVCLLLNTIKLCGNTHTQAHAHKHQNSMLFSRNHLLLTQDNCWE